ncbi:MAG: hypothetical protein AB7G11_08760 [Phycisphaerales bacterium]
MSHPASMRSESASSRRWRRIALAVFAVIACGFFVQLAMWATTKRQSGVRAIVHSRLHLVAQAASIYQQHKGVAPTLDGLLASGLIDPASLSEFSRVQPTTGGADPSKMVPILVQTVPCRAVRKGEAWGGPGETIDKDLPAKRFLLMPDWTVAGMDEPDFQREWAAKLWLSPLK